MRRSRRIYKRKSRSNLETLIILVGAIIILSVAFYMAREKSFLPPEETISEQQNVMEEEKVPESEIDQKTMEELLAQNSVGTDREEISAQMASDQEDTSPAQEQDREVSQVETGIPSAEQTSQQIGNAEESQASTETVRQEQTYNEVDQSMTSGLVYTVQVGYFSVESNARSLATEIGNHGFQTYVLKHNNAYKVQVGAYQERRQAEQASLELKRLGYEIWITQR